MATTKDTGSELLPLDPEADVWRREFETRLRDRLRTIFEPGRWLTSSEVTQASVGAAARLVSMTGRDPEDYVLALAGRHGVGPLDQSIRVFCLDVPEGRSILEGIRLTQKALIDLPADIQAEVDAWDPDHQARVIQPFTMSDALIAGRPIFGGRRPEWVALEDKLAILEIWDAAGINQAPSRVVDLADAGAVTGAHRELAGPLGTVWAVDNDQGWHGGTAGTHWVPDESIIEDLRPRLASSHRRARAMPFLDGVPCSIHGMVIGGEVISFRPSEMLVFRDQAAPKLIYCRSANFWDPPDAITDVMRASAEAIGRELQRRVGFRGVFTLDGVTGSSIDGCEGFVPTEVNMRYGAALPAVLPTAEGDEISLYFTSMAEVAGVLKGEEYGIEPADLQRWVRDALHRQRQSRIMVFVANTPAEGEPTVSVLAPKKPNRRTGVDPAISLDVVDDVDNDSGSSDAVLAAKAQWGGSGDRGIVSVELNGETVPTGPIVAPQALRILRALDRHWNLGLPELEAGPWSSVVGTATSGPEA